MSPAIQVLLLFTVLTLALAVVYVGFRVSRVLLGQAKANAWTRGAPEYQDPAWIRRFEHAHMNCLENLPVYAAVVLAAYMLGQLALLDSLAFVFLAGRLFQTTVHLISAGPLFVLLRATGLVVQWAVLAYWLYALIG